jgi:leader peptidase (prepilin peptidase)/N-methyltransferase
MVNTAVSSALACLAGAGAGVLITGTSEQFTRSQAVWPVLVCQGCGRTPAAMAFFPLLGPLLVRGRCAHCTARTPWLYALAAQLVSVILALLLFRSYGLTWLLGIVGLETTVLVAIALIDLQHRLIPTLLVYPTIVVAFATSPVWPNLGLLTSLAGGAASFGFFLVLALIARLLFGEGALGDGDVSLAGLIGAICGFPVAIVALSMGALLGGIGAILVLAIRRSAIGTTIPYGPFLAAGTIYVLVNGNTIHSMYGFF